MSSRHVERRLMSGFGLELESNEVAREAAATEQAFAVRTTDVLLTDSDDRWPAHGNSCRCATKRSIFDNLKANVTQAKNDDAEWSVHRPVCSDSNVVRRNRHSTMTPGTAIDGQERLETASNASLTFALVQKRRLIGIEGF